LKAVPSVSANDGQWLILLRRGISPTKKRDIDSSELSR